MLKSVTKKVAQNCLVQKRVDEVRHHDEVREMEQFLLFVHLHVIQNPKSKPIII